MMISMEKDMARNYPKEARLSKINAESIIRRAMVVTLLYSLASAFLLCFVYLFAMELVDFHGFKKVAEDPTTHSLVLMQAIDALMEMLSGGSPDIAGIAIVLAGPLVTILYVLIVTIKTIIKLGDVEHSISNPHLKAHKAHFKNKKKLCKVYIAEAKRLKDKGKLYGAKKRLSEIKQKQKEILRFYRFNRYAKNEQTETVYRYWVEKAEKKSKFFYVGFRLIATAFFGYMLVESTGLIEYVENLAIFDEINTQKPLPTIFDALTPVITFGENAKDTLYLQWVYAAMTTGLLFQFITAPLSGKITRVKLADHEITYMHMESEGWIDQIDYNHSYFNMYPHHAGEIYPYYSGSVSKPRRWDESDAILEERPREFGVGLFLLRNLCQVLFCITLVALVLYLFPAMGQIENIEQRVMMGIPFEIVFQVLKWLIVLMLVFLIWHVLSAQEYVFDSMHEETEKRRGKHVKFLVLLLLFVVAYFVLLFIPEMVVGADGSQLSSIETLFKTAVPNSDPTAVEAFVPVFDGIVSSFVTMIIVIVLDTVADVMLRPRERKKKKKEGDDFFAISRSWRNIPMEDMDD